MALTEKQKIFADEYLIDLNATRGKERLTEKCWRNLDPWECCGQDSYCIRGCRDKGGCANGCIVPKLYIRLAKYEDLEEQGLLLRLLCKVGDTAWYVEEDDDDYPIEIQIVRIEIRGGYILYYAKEKYDCGTYELDSYDFGKTVFLTKSEAEEKLRELEGRR